MSRRVVSLFGGTIGPNPVRRGPPSEREIDTRLAAPGQIFCKAVRGGDVEIVRAATSNPAESMRAGVEQVLAIGGWL